MQWGPCPEPLPQRCTCTAAAVSVGRWQLTAAAADSGEFPSAPWELWSTQSPLCSQVKVQSLQGGKTSSRGSILGLIHGPWEGTVSTSDLSQHVCPKYVCAQASSVIPCTSLSPSPVTEFPDILRAQTKYQFSINFPQMSPSSLTKKY